MVKSNKIATTATDGNVPETSIMGLMRMYVDSKLCYHSDPMKTAQFVSEHDRVAYQIDLWTLIDKRKFRKCEKPYNGEPIPGQSLLGFFDYEFELPPTVLKSSRKVYYNLEQTRWKTLCFKCSGVGIHNCSSCNGRGNKTCWSCGGKGFTGVGASLSSCSSCGGRGHINCSTCGTAGKVNCRRCETRGYLLFWWQIHIKWSTVHSVSYQTNTPMTPRKIRKAPTKENYWTYDEEWSYVDTFHGQFEADYAQQKNLDNPVKLEELAKDFNKKHFKKTKKNRQIARLKWVIQSLNIKEVVYQLDGYTNTHMKDLSHRFRFYYYGQDKKNRPLIYENDYPLNACGCFGTGCAHRSMCCTIS